MFPVEIKLKEVSVSYPELFLKTTHIGSLPYLEVERALEVAFSFDIPAWPQLPKYREEGMLWQFVRDFPGFNLEKERVFAEGQDFEEGQLKIYELYLEVLEKGNWEALASHFDLNFCRAFPSFLERAKKGTFSILKGQLTGPFTLGISLKLADQQSLIFREDLQDLLLKFLTLKALFQASLLKKLASQVILFLDEPGLSGFGSSAYISLSKERVLELLKEPVELLQAQGVRVGIHVCANTSWDLVLESGARLINFDSFSYFDRFIIYQDKISEFLSQEDTYLAFGAVPTQKEALLKTTPEEVVKRFSEQLKTLSELTSLPEEKLLKRIMLTPACGLGSLPEDLIPKVLSLLKFLQKSFQ